MTAINVRDFVGRMLYAFGSAMHDAGLALCGFAGDWDAKTDAKVWADQYGSTAEALGADIEEPVEDAVARGAIPHDPREYGRGDS